MHESGLVYHIFPSRVSGQGYKIGLVRLCVCLSVSTLLAEMSVLEGLWGKNTDKEGVAGGRVNAQAFSWSDGLRSLFMFIDGEMD